MKKVIVASFQRSGTHFLINSLASNFRGIENGWVDIVHGPENQWVRDITPHNLKQKIQEQLLDRYYPSNTKKCLKTHYQAYFFDQYLKGASQKYDIFYIVRDPRDVMVACYHYYNNTNFERFIKEPDFSKFLRADLSNVPTETQPFSYSFVKSRNIIDKWKQHILSWLPYKDKEVTFIHFKNLRDHPKETFHYMASRSCQRLNEHLVSVPLEDGRYRPDFKKAGIARGSVGTWVSYFSREDIVFLEGIIPRQIRELTYSKDVTDF